MPVFWLLAVLLAPLVVVAAATVSCVVVVVVVVVVIVVADRFNIALFYALEQTHCARMCFYMSD